MYQSSNCSSYLIKYHLHGPAYARVKILFWMELKLIINRWCYTILNRAFLIIVVLILREKSRCFHFILSEDETALVFNYKRFMMTTIRKIETTGTQRVNHSSLIPVTRVRFYPPCSPKVVFWPNMFFNIRVIC